MTCFAVEGEDRPRSLPCRIGVECLEEVAAPLDAGDPAIHRLVARLGPDATRVVIALRGRAPDERQHPRGLRARLPTARRQGLIPSARRGRA